MLKKLRNLVFILLGLYVIITMVLFCFQEKVIFQSEELPQDFTFELNVPYEEYFVESDSSRIHLLHLESQNPRGAILYFHGNAGSLERWSQVGEYFVQYDYDVYIIDYRNYGKSTGKLNEKGMYEDANRCYDFVKQTWKESGIVVYGRSMGSTFATEVASKNNPKQLILETPFYSITDVAKRSYWMFPIGLLLKYKFPSYKYISQVKCPITIIHGTDDSVVPLKSGEKLYGKANQSNSEMIIIENGEHNNLIEFPEYHQKINEILK